MNAEPRSQHVVPPETANARPALRLLVLLAAAAASAGAVATARGHAATHDAGGVTAQRATAASVARLVAVRAEGEAGLRCASELHALARAHPATTARAVRVDPTRMLACAGGGACLTPATTAAVDERERTLVAQLRRLDDRHAPPHDSALDLVVARAHATAGELCTARDVAATLATAPGRAR